MECRNLEITLQSAKDLNNVNLFSKMDVYAVVSISGGDKSSKQKTKSPVDHNGDANPTWNYQMHFKVDDAALQMNRLTLDFKLVCERALGDKDVGEVSVPIKELLDSPAKPTAEAHQFVSYQVRKPGGKPKGQLSFSYKFSDKIADTFSAPPYAAAIPMGKGDYNQVTAYPAGPSSGYPPPGAYPPPSGYPVADGGSQYHPPTAYPPANGSGSVYPPPAGYPVGDGSSKPGVYPPPPSAGYPAVNGGAYPPPPPAGYGYPPPPPPGYGYPPPPPPGYGYAPQQGYGYPPPPMQQQAKKKNKLGMGLGAGLLGGALGGLLIGDMLSDGADFDCGGFDF